MSATLHNQECARCMIRRTLTALTATAIAVHIWATHNTRQTATKWNTREPR